MSNNKAEPKAPITSTLSINHKLVRKGLEMIYGNIPLTNDSNSPTGINRIGCDRNKAMVFLVLYVKECKTKAIEAIKPPIKPPPDR